MGYGGNLSGSAASHVRDGDSLLTLGVVHPGGETGTGPVGGPRETGYAFRDDLYVGTLYIV